MDLLAQIREIARRETGPWGEITAQPVDYRNHELRIHELDEVVTDRPLFIILSGWWGMINSRAVEEPETSRQKVERVPDLSLVGTGARFLNPVRVRNL